MRNGPARLTEISLCSSEIPSKRAELFSYDRFSLANRAENLLIAYVQLIRRFHAETKCKQMSREF